MIPADAMTPASAIRRIEAGDGASTESASMRTARAIDAREKRKAEPAAALAEAESVSTTRA